MVKMIPEDEPHEHPAMIHAVGVAEFHRKEAQVAVGELAKAGERNKTLSHQLIAVYAELDEAKKLVVQAQAERDAANIQVAVVFEKYENLQERVLDMAERLTAARE